MPAAADEEPTMPPDLDKMNKLPSGARFFDVNDLWYFANRWAVRFLYSRPITANQVTLLSMVFGVVAAGLYLNPSDAGLWGAAFFLYGKIFLDNVDGNLARVRGEVSRIGRFLDSLTDFIVTVLVYLAVTWRVYQQTGDPFVLGLGGFALISGLLQCSYFVFYLVSYTTSYGAYSKNRVDERVRPADREAVESGALSRVGLCLQHLHGALYGWQDRAIEALDRVSRKWAGAGSEQRKWVGEKWFLTSISPLCLCTNNMILVVFTLFDSLQAFLCLVAVGGNAYLLAVQALKVAHYRR